MGDEIRASPDQSLFLCLGQPGFCEITVTKLLSIFNTLRDGAFKLGLYNIMHTQKLNNECWRALLPTSSRDLDLV